MTSFEHIIPDGPDAPDALDLSGPSVASHESTLGDPFADPSISSETQLILDSVTETMTQARVDYQAIADTEGLPARLPEPGAESAAAFIDAAMNADAQQARRMVAFEQGLTYEQDVHNNIEDKEREVREAEETSSATAEAEYRAWEAERAVRRAEATVDESRRAGGA